MDHSKSLSFSLDQMKRAQIAKVAAQTADFKNTALYLQTRRFLTEEKLSDDQLRSQFKQRRLLISLLYLCIRKLANTAVFWKLL